MVAKCHLEFDGFDQFFIKALRKVFEANLFPDVTLIGDDEYKIEAHRIILSAHSSVFEKALFESKSTKPTLRLKGFSYQDLSFLMQYLYLGEVSLPFAQASELLKMAKFLRIPQLGSECNVTDKLLNRIFSIAEENFVSIDSGKGVTLTQSSEVVTIRKNESSEENFLDEAYQSYYKNIESEIDDLGELEFDSSDAEKENNKTSPLENDKIQEDKKQRKKRRKLVYPGEGYSNIEGQDCGADMVGKLLPSCEVPTTTTTMKAHINKMDPAFMDQFKRQQKETKNALQILREKKRIAKLEKKEEKIRKKKFKEEMDKIRLKLGKREQTFDRIDRLSAKEPNYDFKNLDEDILTTEVGAPRENHCPRDAIVYSHNFFRKLHPIRNLSQTSLKSYAECITCAQRNKRNILKLTGASTTPMLTHIKTKHRELASKLKELQNEKRSSLYTIKLAKNRRRNQWKALH